MPSLLPCLPSSLYYSPTCSSEVQRIKSEDSRGGPTSEHLDRLERAAAAQDEEMKALQRALALVPLI